jgi:hypothetical protein
MIETINFEEEYGPGYSEDFLLPFVVIKNYAENHGIYMKHWKARVWFKREYLLPTIKIRMFSRLYLPTNGWRLLKSN